jgi:enterochelin esterase-like enzyme
MNSDFDPPPQKLSVWVNIGGVITAMIAIALLEFVSRHLHQTADTFKVQAKANAQLSSPTVKPSTPQQNQELAQAVQEKLWGCQYDGKAFPQINLVLEVKTFYSNAMGEERSYGVILPPGYHTNPQTTYPVIFLLHGGNGDAKSWEACGAVTAVLFQLYKTGRLPPAIVVTPDGNDKRGKSRYWDTQYFDGSNGKVGTLIGSELVEEVKYRYRVHPEPQFWAIGGLSSGGWGAFNIGWQYTQQFSSLFSLSGYFTDATGARNSPLSLVQQLSPEQRQQVRVYLDAGINDQKYLNATEDFHQQLVKEQIVHRFDIFPGGHGLENLPDTGWHYWHKHLADALTYVGEAWKLSLSATSPTKSVPQEDASSHPVISP